MVAIIDKAAGILLRPVETIRGMREESLGDAFQFYGVLLVLYAILSSLFGLAGGFFFFPWGAMSGLSTRFGFLPAMFFLFLVVGTILFFLVGLLLGGALLHLFVYLVGGKKGIEQTLKAVMCSTTPVFVFGWIPLIGFFAAIYTLVLEILAVRELQEISTGRAILAVLLPFLLVLLLIVLALSFFLIAFSTTGPAWITG
ncbi:MAG: YIP1 family protein [Methanomicrobiales archaeon]|nr:YIP1 family protein [Methanomicrobiales archaeon]